MSEVTHTLVTAIFVSWELAVWRVGRGSLKLGFPEGRRGRKGRTHFKDHIGEDGGLRMEDTLDKGGTRGRSDSREVRAANCLVGGPGKAEDKAPHHFPGHPTLPYLVPSSYFYLPCLLTNPSRTQHFWLLNTCHQHPHWSLSFPNLKTLLGLQLSIGESHILKHPNFPGISLEICFLQEPPTTCLPGPSNFRFSFHLAKHRWENLLLPHLSFGQHGPALLCPPQWPPAQRSLHREGPRKSEFGNGNREKGWRNLMYVRAIVYQMLRGNLEG